MLALLTGGREIKGKEVDAYAELLGVTPRSCYRYLTRIDKALFVMREKKFQEKLKKLQKKFVD